jgi:hypothetical protein
MTANNPPIPDHPCPECGSLLLQRPTKGPRCWNCGAETDENFVVTKSGDPEAEAAVRAATAEARAARAAAKAAKGAKTKKPAAKKKAPAKKKPATTKAPAKEKAVATAPAPPES